MSLHTIKRIFAISIVSCFQIGLIGCVPEHDVMIVNCSGNEYNVQVIDDSGFTRRKAFVNADSIARIKGAVYKTTKNDTFVFRFESKAKKKEIKQSWEELGAHEWIIPVCD